MNDTQPLTHKDPESLQQRTLEQLVSVIVQQQARIEQLQQEIEQLKLQQKSNSQTSSKPPATDLIRKSEKPKQKNEADVEGKRKPGGQPGHPGRTRKGFGRVDRYEVLRPQKCPDCGGEEFVDSPIAVQRQQVARLVERPIEVVEYQRQTCQCVQCWAGSARYAAGLLLRSLREKAVQWWYFLDHPEVPPDNNRAERSLRLAVTKRKVCGGSRSMNGFGETADLLSVIQTCRSQGRFVIEFFKQAMHATVSTAVPKPSLIPQT